MTSPPLPHEPGGALITRPIAVLMVLLSLAVIGTIAYRRMPLQLMPPLGADSAITLFMPVEESSPEAVLERVTEPIEESFRTIPGVVEISSTSDDDQCVVRVSHSSNADGDAIYADIRDRVERLLPSLPASARHYRLLRFNLDTDMPVLWVAIGHPDDAEDSDGLLENVLQPRIESIPGVARVDMRGLIQRRVDIELDPDRVRAYGIDVGLLIERLRGENVVAPGGAIREAGGRYLLRVASRFKSFDDLRSYPVNDSLTLGDIATVDYRHAVKDFLVRVDGRLANLARVYKQSEANTVETCERVERLLEDDLSRDPRLAGFTYLPFFSHGRVIRASIGNLETTALWGGLLAIAALYLFLRRFSVTFVVAAAIPISVLIAVVVMFFAGGSLNIISIMGLTLALGMLVDNAIVVVENIFRLREQGLPVRTAAIRGTHEVGLAVTLGTLTTIVVFLPVIMLADESRMRMILAELGLPLSYSLLASLLVAMVVAPAATIVLMRGRYDVAAAAPEVSRPGRFAAFRWRELYQRTLGWVLGHRFYAVLIFAGVLASGAIPWSALSDPQGEKKRVSRLEIELEFPPAFTLLEADRVVKNLQSGVFVPRYKELGIETSACWYWRGGGTLALFLEEAHITTRAAFLARVKPLLPELPGITVRLGLGNERDDEAGRVDVEASGRDPRVLSSLLDRLATELRSVDGVLDVNTAREVSDDQVMVNLRPDLAQRYDVSPASAAMLVSWALRGAPLADYESEDEELPLWIQFKGADMDDMGDLYRVEVYTRARQAIALANVAGFSIAHGLPEIERRDGRVRQWMQILVEDDVDQGRVRQLVAHLARRLDVPDGYEIGVSPGRSHEEIEFFARALVLGVTFIFLLLGVLFESLFLSFAVFPSLFCIPTGVLWAMYLGNEPFDPAGIQGIAFLLLPGIVVNNAILIIDCINRFRATEPDRTRAILSAGTARIRPVLMTAGTTICGLLPFVFVRQSGEGIDYRPLTIVVLGGMVSATAMTLYVVPLFYTLLEDLRARLTVPLRRARGTRSD